MARVHLSKMCMALQGNVRRSRAGGKTALSDALAAGPAGPLKPNETQPVAVEQAADATAAAAASAPAPAAAPAEPARAQVPAGSSSAAPRGKKRKAIGRQADESAPQVKPALSADIMTKSNLLGALRAHPESLHWTAI